MEEGRGEGESELSPHVLQIPGRWEEGRGEGES